MPNRYTQQNKVTARVLAGPAGAQQDFGVFTSVSGFELEGETSRYGEGPVGAGVRTRSDGELGRAHTDADMQLRRDWEARYGQPVVVTVSVNGDDGLPLGNPDTYTGVVGGCSGPEGDAEGNDRGMFTVTVPANVTRS